MKFIILFKIYHIIILALYVVCGIIRLAYFNVAMSDKNKAIEFYQGLPVPVSVFIFGLVWLLFKIFDFSLCTTITIYTVLVPIVGFLHISKIRIKKYTGTWFYVAVSLIALTAIILGLFVGQFVDWCNKRLPEHKKVFSLDMFKEYKEQQVRTLSKIVLISMKEGKM